MLKNMLRPPPSLNENNLLVLDIPTIKNILPNLKTGDLALMHGSHSVASLSSLLCVKAQLPKQLGGLASAAVFIDGGNTFRLYQITRIAQLNKLDPMQVLNKICIARAFTAYQMKALITEKLPLVIKATGAKLVIIADIAATFLDGDLSEHETQKVYHQVMEYLSKFADAKHVIIVATYPPHEDTRRNDTLYSATYGKANVVAALSAADHHRTFILEKHPCFALGSAEFLSRTTTTLPQLLWRVD